MKLETKEDWCKLIKLDEKEQKQVLYELYGSGKLSYHFENNFDVYFNYASNGWNTWQYNLSLGKRLYFTRKEDIANYKDAVLELRLEQDKKVKNAAKHDKSEWVIFQYLVVG